MTTDAQAFLAAILPDLGVYISWTKIDGNRSYNQCHASIESLASFILSEDAQGKTVYHACATFKEQRGAWNERKQKWEQRSHANAYGARALWLDIDAGKGKPWATMPDAAEAVETFCYQTGFPAPIYVGSGSGLHVYWPLAHTLNPVDWLPYAQGLKTLAEQHNLGIDPTRTADIASVLRTPGTHNRKREIVAPVQAGPLQGPYPLELFTRLLSVKPLIATTRPGTQATGLNAALMSQPVHQAAYAERLVEQCGQVRALRETKGNLTEPLWYAALGVLSFCVDGDKFAHEWSSGYPQYSERETQDKLDRTKLLTGATTCAKFASLNSATCSVCPFAGKITSPIVLGQASLSPALLTTLPQTIVLDPPDQPLPKIPSPWKWSIRKQLVMEISRDDRDSEVLISEYPIFLDGVQTGEVQSGAFSYHFKQWLPHRGWIDIHIPARTLMGSSGFAELFGRGAVIHDAKAFIAYVRAAVDQYHSQQEPRMRYDQFGWKANDTAFLYGRNLYNAAGKTAVVGSEEIKTRSQWLVPQRGGSLEGWSGAANALFQIGCEAQSFGLLCAFAAPLMRFHTVEEGGAIIALHSMKSGQGKSTALAGAKSVWGMGKGLELTNIDTRVSKALTLAVLGNLPVIYDELTNKDPEIIKEFVMTFTNGRDRMRGTSEGEIRHVNASWQTLLISASNKSLVDMLQFSGGSDALSFRVLEFPLELPESVDHRRGDWLVKRLEANAGFAGDAYLRYLVQPSVLEWVRATLPKWTAELWENTGLRAEHRFWVRTLGSVAVAAAIVNHMGLLAFQPSRILEWAKKQIVETKDDAPVTTGGSENAVEALSTFLNEHIPDTLVMQRGYHHGDRGPQRPLLEPRRSLLVRYEVEPGVILVAERAFRKWCLTKEMGSRETIASLKREKIIFGNVNRTLSGGTNLPGGQVYCLEVNAKHPALSGVLAEIVDLQAVRKVS